MAINDLIPVLQVAIGPVIIISGTGLLLSSMNNRLGRTVDRMRVLSDLKRKAGGAELTRYQSQIAVLWRRAKILRAAISLAACGALIAAVMVIVLFVGTLLQLKITTTLVALFVACMATLSMSLIYFLRDVNLSLHALALELEIDPKTGR